MIKLKNINSIYWDSGVVPGHSNQSVIKERYKGKSRKGKTRVGRRKEGSQKRMGETTAGRQQLK